MLQASIAERGLASFFKRTLDRGGERRSVGHVLSELLDQGDADGDILIVHHDGRRDSLFLAWILTHYAPTEIAPIWPVLDALAACMETEQAGRGAVASTVPSCLEALRIEGRRVVRAPCDPVANAGLGGLSDRLWSFATREQFPDAAGSMRHRDYQCKSFKRAWKSYLRWRDDMERPARIAAATDDNPYRLIGNVFCAGGKVFERHDYSKRDIVLPGADALTLCREGHYFADKSRVWCLELAPVSPPARIVQGDHVINNPGAIWEYVVIPGADGARFTWLYDRWDTMFWTDEQRIYSLNGVKLVPLPDVRASAFRQFGQCFGTDGRSVFWFAQRLPLNPDRLQTEGYFIWDDEKVFQCAVELPLRADGFRILGREDVPGAAGRGCFTLADNERTILWGLNGVVLPEDPSLSQEQPR